ncbi:MAG: hypothetical protein GVY29_11810 [Spirochaetes bacterium]|jgi:hypothetical protein|nr:hypothetical protein [Spirochaetota bacterium]
MIRILQFTDLHFREALPGHSGLAERLSRHGPVLLKALAARIADENPDLVAFTGDIIDAPHDLLHGTADSMFEKTLAQAVHQDYRKMRSWLDSLERAWMIAPGNHDYRQIFEKVFGDASRHMRLPGINVYAYFDWEVRDNTAERLTAERERFERALGQCDPGDLTVHLQHFLIWPQVSHDYPMRYREADELRDRLIESQGRHIVLSGHFHHGTDCVDLSRTRFAVCPAVCETPHRYRVFEFSGGRCSFREENLLPEPLANRRLLLVDRSDFLTMPENNSAGQFSIRPEPCRVFRAAREAGFEPVILSVWNDNQSVGLSWGDILKKHDRMFYSLGEIGCEQGSGLVIALDGNRPLPSKLPSEPISWLSGIAQSVAGKFGVDPDRIWLLSRDHAHRARFGSDRTFVLKDLEDLK